MTLNLTIRPATRQDQDFILKLVPRFVEFGSPSGRDPATVAGAIGMSIHQALISGSRNSRAQDLAFFIAEDSVGRRLGFIFLTSSIDPFTQELHGHISDIAVSSEANGQGVGQALMKFAEGWAKAQNYRFLTLNAFADNARVRSFYSQLGYREDIVKYLKRLS